MIKSFRWFSAAVVVVTGFVASSCYYDPYVSGGAGYGSGYYGGGGGLSTTFVYTGSDRWLYDPAVYCYYDRYRRCYYDPYLYGYYPAGYCPRPIYGAYHPGGWNGRGQCPPPSGFRDRYLSNYQNRVDLLKAKNYAWAHQVRERNDATAEAWRDRRSHAAANFQEARDAQQARGQQARDYQAQRQQDLRAQQQERANRASEPRATAPRVQRQPQRQPRPAYNQPVVTRPGSQPRIGATREPQAAQRAAPQQAQRQANRPGAQAASPQRPQVADGGLGGAAYPERMPERRNPRGR